MEYERNRLTVWSFIKGLFKVVIGFSLLVQSLLFLILLVFILGIFGAVSSTLSDETRQNGPSIAVPDGGALLLNPVGMLTEKAPPQDALELAIQDVFGSNSVPEVSVHDIVGTIRAAKDDSRINALVLDLQGLYVPSIYASKSHYIADAVEDFRDSGKRVVAIGDMYTQEQYLIASEADTVLLHDMGMIVFEGYGRYNTYMKSFLDMIKVKANVFRVGTYKSAVEPYLRDNMSDPAREANTAYLNTLWNAYMDRVEDNRDLADGKVRNVAENYDSVMRQAGGDRALAMLENGFVDQLMDRGEQISFIVDIVGKDSKDGKSFKGISYQSYRYSVPRDNDRDGVPNVAIITAAGAIVDGNEPEGVAAGDIVSRELRDARLDDNVKAVVLRVDSPGGSVFASEVIRDEVIRMKLAGKPIVTSMGSLAASGGYWISASTDEIWASPTTITGSIGVYAVLPTFEGTLNEVGVTIDGVGTTPMSSLQIAGFGDLPEPFADTIQSGVEANYRKFLSIVSEGRGMTMDGADQIAQGRVWSGVDALEIGLADKLGSLDDAVASVAAMAKLTEYDAVGVSAAKTKFELFLEKLAGQDISDAQLQALRNEAFAIKPGQSLSIAKIIQLVQSEVKVWASFNDPAAMYARCMECVVR